MELRVLGDVQIEVDGRVIGLDRSAERCVLATLAFNPNRPVHLDTLVDHVWGGRPPAKAEQTIASYVRAVRRAIEEAGGHRDWLRNRRPRAYELRVSPTVVDYHRFCDLARTGRARAEEGDQHAAISAFHQALSLWRADPLRNVGGGWADRRRQALHRDYLAILYPLLELEAGIGDHEAVVARASQAVDDIVPTDRLIALAIRSLAHCGHTSMIRGFVRHAADRMWQTVQVRPGPDIEALARRLAAGGIGQKSGPDRGERHRPQHGQPAAIGEVEQNRNRFVEPPPEPSRHGTVDESVDGQSPHGGVVMMAAFNQNVYQSSGDQHITEV